MPLKPNIFDCSLQSLADLFQEWGEPEFRAKQTWQGLYQNLWDDPTHFSTIPLACRQQLANTLDFSAIEPQTTWISRDGLTKKILFSTRDGSPIETVLMIYRQRKTLCVSTQSGCAMGCVFCATGQMGFKRNLSHGEIIEQVLYFARQLKADVGLTNVVFMGMGEPFHNYDASLQAIQQLNDHNGFNLGARNFTISTVGIVPGIQRFTEENSQVNLAISLHAADDVLRSRLIPINSKYPIKVLIDACRAYVSRTHRRITFEWALIQDINDDPSHARQLANLLKGMLCHVNVIPLNPIEKYSGKPTSNESARLFKQVLENNHIPCTIRLRRGLDIQAGCGQLASFNNPVERFQGR